MTQVDAQEREAVAMLQRGDVRGLGFLVQRHQAAALRVVTALTRDPHLAEDIVADAFIAVYTNIHQFQSHRPFAPWFYRIVLNRARSVLRVRSRTSNGESAAAFLGNQLSRTTPEMEAESAETRLIIIDAVQRLPAKQREVVILRYYAQWDERSIAEALNCPYGTVRWRLHAARQRLRASLKHFKEDTPMLQCKGETV